MYGCIDVWFKEENRFLFCIFSNSSPPQSKWYKKHWNNYLGCLQLNCQSSCGNGHLSRGMPLSPAFCPLQDRWREACEYLFIRQKALWSPPWLKFSQRFLAGAPMGAHITTDPVWGHGLAAAVVGSHFRGWVPPATTGIPKELEVIALVRKWWISEKNKLAARSHCLFIFSRMSVQ